MPRRDACQAGGGGRRLRPSFRVFRKNGRDTRFPRQCCATNCAVILWLNCRSMFARRIRVEYEENGRRVACPLKWLDSFSMRNLTNATVFDNTLPVADGVMEIGSHVPVKELKAAMEDWFRRKSYLAKEQELVIEESKP